MFKNFIQIVFFLYANFLYANSPYVFPLKLEIQSNDYIENCGYHQLNYTFYQDGKFELSEVCSVGGAPTNYQGRWKDDSFIQARKIERIVTDLVINNNYYTDILDFRDDTFNDLISYVEKTVSIKYDNEENEIEYKIISRNFDNDTISRAELISNLNTKLMDIGYRDNKKVYGNDVNPGCSIDYYELMGCDFSNRDLSNLDLKQSNFSGANLSNTNLSNTNLWSSNFTDAILINTSFNGADLRGSKFENNKMINTNFDNSLLTNAEIKNSNLSNINFNNTRLDSTSFNSSIFINVRFNQAETIDHLMLYQSSFDECEFDNISAFKITIMDSDLSKCESFEDIKIRNGLISGNNLGDLYLQMKEELSRYVNFKDNF